MPVTVSVIIPARNAALTLPETLRSLLAQAYTGWEAIVIDDGSTDPTARVAARFAAQDPRIRAVSQPPSGVSAARNAGVVLARGDQLLFLDADDLILPQHLERLTARLDIDPALDAAHCGWAQLTPAGAIVGHQNGPGEADLFAAFSRYCVFAIHACVVRKVCVEAVGGFDPTLKTCEDFDLWQRIARTGARFGAVADVLAIYRMRPDSASVDGHRVLMDGLRVIGQAHEPDVRVPISYRSHVLGRPRAELPEKQLLFACWCAGLVIGRDDDAAPLLNQLTRTFVPSLAPREVANSLFQTVPVARCLPPAAWSEIWQAVEQRVDDFLRALEEHSGVAGLRRESRRILEDLILGQAAGRLPVTIGGTHGLELEASEPIADVRLAEGIERLRCSVFYQGERLGTLYLPVIAGAVSSYVLKDAVAADYAWEILQRYFQHTLGPSLLMQSDETGTSVWRGSTCLATGILDDSGSYSTQVHAQAGWTLFLQELWARPHWTMNFFYDRQAPEEPGDVVEVGDGWLTLEVSRPLPDVVATNSTANIVVTAGGVPIGALALVTDAGRLPAAGVRAAITRACGFELCRVAVREGLLGGPDWKPASLQARLAAAADRAAQSRVAVYESQVPGGVLPAPDWPSTAARALGTEQAGILIARRSSSDIDSASSRRAALPPEMAAELTDAAAQNGEPVLHVPDRTGSQVRVMYVPDLIWRQLNSLPTPASEQDSASRSPVAAREHGRALFERYFAAQVDPWKYTSPYEQVKYEQTLDLLPSGPIIDALEVGCAEGHFTAQLASRVSQLVAADISEIALQRAAERCSGRQNVRFMRLDLTADSIPARFDLLVCSELLYYMGDQGGLATVVRKLADAIKPGGHLLHAHAHLVVDAPDQPGFDWAHPFGAKVIGETLAATAPLHLIKELRTPLYRIQLFRHGPASGPPQLIEMAQQPTRLLPEVEEHVLWQGGTPQIRSIRSGPETAWLPIVMYHRVARSGPSALDRYRVTPATFEAHLAYLRDGGYHSVSLAAWRDAMARHSPLPGRAILITFDDGYRDFLTDAWPLLKRYGFSAQVFLVADEVGGVNRWDAGYGENVPLLDWQEIRRLQMEGVSFGSHTARHKRLTALTPAEVVQELTRSRAILNRELGTAVTAVAYPYGAVDPVVQHLAGACGFTVGLTCRSGRAGLWESPLLMPRIEVRGDSSFADFVTVLGE